MLYSLFKNFTYIESIIKQRLTKNRYPEETPPNLRHAKCDFLTYVTSKASTHTGESPNVEESVVLSTRPQRPVSKVLILVLTLLHSKRPKLYRVLAVLSAIWLQDFSVLQFRFGK